MAVFCHKVMLCSILPSGDGGKVIVYVVSCPTQGCYYLLFTDFGCSRSVVVRAFHIVTDLINAWLGDCATGVYNSLLGGGRRTIGMSGW
jgi:hypothetical protein